MKCGIRMVCMLLLTLLGMDLAGQTLFMAMENLPKAARQYQKSHNIQDVPILYASDFDPEDDGEFDARLLERSINKKIPDARFSGIAVIDWEEPGITILEKGDIASPEHRTTTARYLELLALCKKARPNAQWGYYGIPFTSYWDSAGIRNTNDKIASLLTAVDAYFPSIYSFYPASTPYTNNAAYFHANANAAAQISMVNNKKLYVFVWHRYHQSNADVGLKSIPESEFQSDIDFILKGSKASNKFEGIIWWGADEYFFRTGNEKVKNEVGRTSYDTYESRLVTSYGNLLLQKMAVQ